VRELRGKDGRPRSLLKVSSDLAERGYVTSRLDERRSEVSNAQHLHVKVKPRANFLNLSTSQPTFSRPTSNGPRVPIHATVLTVWREKPLLNLRKDFMEPLFGTFSSILIVANVSLQLRYTIFSRFKLVGKLLSQIEGMFAVFFSHAGGFVKQVQNSPPGGIKLINAVGNRAFRGRCKWDHRL
jgi:hypothetical protein